MLSKPPTPIRPTTLRRRLTLRPAAASSRFNEFGHRKNCGEVARVCQFDGLSVVLTTRANALRAAPRASLVGAQPAP